MHVVYRVPAVEDDGVLHPAGDGDIPGGVDTTYHYEGGRGTVRVEADGEIPAYEDYDVLEYDEDAGDDDGDDEYVCDECGYVADGPAGLSGHMSAHAGD